MELVELSRSVIILPMCHVSYLSFVRTSDLMCNSVLLSAVFSVSFALANISLQKRGVFCPTLSLLLFFFSVGAAAPSGPGPPHSRRFFLDHTQPTQHSR